MKSIVIVYAGSELPAIELSKIDNVVRKFTVENSPIHITTINDEETASAITAKVVDMPKVPEKTPEELAAIFIGEKYFVNNMRKADAFWKMSVEYMNAQKAIIKDDNQKALIRSIKLLAQNHLSLNGNICKKYKFDEETYSRIREIYNNLTI